LEDLANHNIILRLGLLTTFIFGLYIYFSWSSGALVIPYTLSMIAGSLLLAQSAWLPIRFVFFFMSIVGFLLVHTIATYTVGTAFLLEKIKAIILFSYAILLSLVLLKELLLFSNQLLAKYFFYFTLFIGILCVLHIFLPPFQSLHNFFLSTVHGIEGKDSSLRDILQHGGMMRPFPFTTEPSHVSKFVFVTWSAWLYLEEKKRYTLFFIGAFLLFLIIRSPIILPLFGVGLIAILTEGEKKYRFQTFIICLLLSLILLPMLSGFIYQALEGRIMGMIQGNDLSTIYRIVLPNYFLKAIVLNNPFMGVGIGNVEVIIDLYNGLDSRLMYIEYQPNWYYFTSFIAPILYFGIAGSILFTSIIYLFFSRRSSGLSIKRVIFFYCVFILANAIGSFYNLLFWAYIAIVYRFSLDDK